MLSRIWRWPWNVSAGALVLGERQLRAHLASITFFSALAALIGHGAFLWIHPHKTLVGFALVAHLGLLLLACVWYRRGVPSAAYRCVFGLYCYMAAAICLTAYAYGSAHALLQFVPLNVAGFFFIVQRRLLLLALAWGTILFGAALTEVWGQPMLPEYVVLVIVAWAAALAIHTGRVSVLEALHRAQQALRAEVQERRSAEARALVSKKRESLGLMAGGIAHDFNNLLTTIVGGADLLTHSQGQAVANSPGITMIRDSAGAAQDLCRSLLDYAGGGVGEQSAIDLNTVAADAVRLSRPRLTSQTALVAEHCGDPVWVWGNAGELRQAAVNLISNAVEAFDGKPGIIRVITDVLEEEGEALGRLRVLDNGPGISAEAQERIFDPFFTTKPTGRGLGLASVAAIMSAHGGQIDVASEAGGTAFELRLPAPRQDSPATPVAAELDRHQLPSFRQSVQDSRQASQLDMLFATVFDQLPHLVIQKDRANTTLRVNKAMAALRGVTTDAMANTRTERWHPDEADAYFQDDQEVIRTGAPKVGIREQIELAGGEKHWFITDKVPTFGADGAVTGVLVFSRRQESLPDEQADSEARQIG